MNESSLDIIAEESAVGLEASLTADAPWLRLAHLDEVLRVMSHVHRNDPAASVRLRHDLIHPVIQAYSALATQCGPESLSWSNMVQSVRLLRNTLPSTDAPPHRLRDCRQVLEEFESLCRHHTPLLKYHVLGNITHGEKSWPLVKITAGIPPGPFSQRMHVAITAGVHGDEAEGTYALHRWLQITASRPQILQHYTFHIFPLLNPFGFEHAVRTNAGGVDLNRDFTAQPTQPETRLVAEEFDRLKLEGLLNLHSDDGSEGIYGYANGSLLSQALVKPALQVASTLIPINRNEIIDQHPAREGVIENSHYEGTLRLLAARSGSGLEPFDITLETPNLYSLASRVSANILMIRTVFDEHLKFISQAMNL